MATTLEAPIIAPPAIQIPSSQWRMALKPSKPSIPSKPTHLQTSRRSLPRSKTAQAFSQGSRPSSSTYPVKKSHLDNEKWENCIRMQVALRPQCRKLLRKISYIMRWKARWRKFESTRRSMGASWRLVVNPYHGRLMASLALPEPDAKPDAKPDKKLEKGVLRPGVRRAKSGGKRKAAAMSLDEMDELERAWWGDGFPVYMSEEDKMGIEGGKLLRECWLDEVD